MNFLWFLGSFATLKFCHKFSQPSKQDVGDFNCASECGLYSAKDKVTVFTWNQDVMSNFVMATI